MSKLYESPHRNASGGIGGINVATLTGYADRLARIGANEEAARIREAVARHDAIADAARAAIDLLTDERDQLAHAVASGDLDPVTAADKLVKAEERAALAGPARDMVTSARRVVVRDEVRRLRSSGDALVSGVLAPIVESAAVELADAVAALPEGVDNPGAAIAAGTEAADAWRVATAAVERIETAWRLAAEWRKDGIVFTLRPPALPLGYWQWYGPPSRTPRTLTEWADAIEEGRRPTVLTAREVLDHHVAPPSPSRVAAYARRDALAAKLNGTGPEAA